MAIYSGTAAPPDAAGSNPAGLSYHHRAWKKGQGLPDDTVNAITQTKDGYLWIGTRGGLVRFDGVKFSVFDRSNTPEITSDEIHCLHADDDGGLWIGTARGLWHRSAEGFDWSQPGEQDCSRVRDLALSSDGLWVLTACGLHQFTAGKLGPPIPATAPPTRINAIQEDPTGGLWLGMEHGLRRLDPITGKLSEPLVPPDLARRVPQVIVQRIERGPDGTLWADFRGFRLTDEYLSSRTWVFGFRNGEWIECSANPFCNDERPFFIGHDLAGALWLPNGERGVVRYHDGRTSTLPFDEMADYATCFFADHEGNIWVGTETKGLHRFRPKHVTTLSGRRALAHDNAWTVCESRDGTMWIGTDGGVTQHSRDGRVAHFTTREGLPANTVRSIVEDERGVIWVGTGNGLTYRRNNTWKTYELAGGLSANKIRVLHPARDGVLWVGREAGLARIEGNRLKAFTTADGLGHNDVRALVEDRSGALWLGTYGGGLHRMSGGRIERFSTTNGLASDFVWALHEDGGGALWIGTDRGLHRYKDGRFAIFTRHHGLFDDAINHVLEDDFGRLWISTDRGIYRVGKRQLESAIAPGRPPVTCVVYDEEDGLLGAEANGRKSQPAGCKARDGRLWFPMTKGVVVFDPKNLPDNTNAPPLIIEQIRANGEPVLDDGSSVASRRLPRFDRRNPTMRLPAGSAHIIDIQYTAPSFVAAEDLHFKHRLIGLDKDWIDAGTRRMAHYANLLPRRYEFRVIAVNKYGVWNDSGASFNFSLAPFVWQTWWFRAICLALPAALGMALYRRRMREHRRIAEAERRAALASERAEIARDLHDHLGARLTLVQHLSQTLGRDSSPESNGEPAKLIRLASELNSSLDSAVWAVQPDKDTLLSLVDYLGDSSHELLRETGIELNLEFPDDIPAWPLSRSERYHLALVAVEALNNILKHSHATLVRLSLELNDKSFTLCIADNGQGFDRKELGGHSHPLRAGNGLANMRLRVEGLGGRFDLRSQPGQGATILITLAPAALRETFAGH